MMNIIGGTTFFLTITKINILYHRRPWILAILIFVIDCCPPVCYGVEFPVLEQARLI